MQTFCVRQGQIEVGVIEHEGREFTAMGSSVIGVDVTGYTSQKNRRIVLTTWCGKTMLGCRCEVVERFWNGSLALMFRLPHRRFLIGYALGDDGMLFRSELMTGSDESEARRAAVRISHHFAELDTEDDEVFEA